MTTITNVPAATVRIWGRDNLSKLTDAAVKSASAERGRLHAELVEAFNGAHRTKRYVAGVGTPKVSDKPVTFDATMLDKLGRKRTGSVTMTVAEIREMLGSVGGRGRLPHVDTIRAAYEAQYAESVADTFTADAA